MPSKAYEDFEHDFLNANSWPQRKDGVPLELLDALDGHERAKAETALIQRISADDDWPACGLGHLRSQKALIPLRALLPKTKGSVRAATALAIWQIARDPTMVDELLRLSRSEYTDHDKSLKTFTMIDVIYCLAHLPQSAAAARLEELKQSANYLIAYNAKSAFGLLNSGYYSDGKESSPDE